VSETEATAQQINETYRNLPDDSLLELASEGGLTSQAANALHAEMARRSLGAKDVDELKQWKKDNPPMAPHGTKRTYWGNGIGYVGKKPVSAGHSGRQFITTRFIVLKWVTAIPIGSYIAVEGPYGYPIVERRVSLQWDQAWEGSRDFLSALVIGVVGAALSIYFSKGRHR
jgi:hypothetical protein